ncbi:hypothetical protein B9479_005999 [Cryptococcus floricola]|uniref:CCHC-type domain-containing protein n=1 Tax=Cryptococcus floricola TaxID=2591691 RepID=A0A5D3AT03_9TREE|nr:hypothetical protein B9479_005999 [Cryptococcus floricola]
MSAATIKILENQGDFDVWFRSITAEVMKVGGYTHIMRANTEPYRTRVTDRMDQDDIDLIRTPGAIAGADYPETAERDDDEEDLDSSEIKEWRRWAKVEMDTRGILMAGVTSDIHEDLLELWSSFDVVQYLRKAFDLDPISAVTRYERAIGQLTLRPSASAPEMENHIKTFDRTYKDLVQARTRLPDPVKLPESEKCRAFVNSCANNAADVDHIFSPKLAAGPVKWQEVVTFFKHQTERRRTNAYVADESEGNVMAAIGEPRSKAFPKKTFKKGKVPGKGQQKTKSSNHNPSSASKKCDFCFNKGHLERECRTKRRQMEMNLAKFNERSKGKSNGKPNGKDDGDESE